MEVEMLNFSNHPSPEGRRPGIDLMRTPANRPFVGIITSDDLVGTPTHYYHNRTIPCEGESCPICGEGFSWRWHGYFSCVDQATQEHVLFEVTANASDPLRAYHHAHGTLRGCQFKATRRAGRYNGRVTIQTKPADLAGKLLPKGANLIAMLCHIWNVPMPEAEISGRMKDHPRIKVHQPASGDGNTH